MTGSTRHRPGRRTWIRTAVVTGLMTVSSLMSSPEAAADGGPSLYVFVSSSEKPRSLQKKLQAKMPGIQVTVFGRFRDFENAATSGGPDAVLSMAEVLAELGFSPELKGAGVSGVEEPYVIVAVGREIDPGRAQDLTIGSVDLLGRTKMKGFVAGLLALGSPVKVKLVTKTEDLLPLLQFGAADAVVLPERQQAEFMARTELDLKAVVLPGKAGLPAGAALTAAGQTALDALKSLDSATAGEMGVLSWQ